MAEEMSEVMTEGSSGVCTIGQERRVIGQPLTQEQKTMAADPTEMSNGLYMTVEQYLALDDATDGKYEFLDGYAYMLRPPSSMYDKRATNMAGGSVNHAAICARITTILGQALRDSSCTVYTSDARMKLAEDQYLYPDLVVACGEQSGTMLVNPTVVIEVISSNSEKRDRGEKLKTYKSLPFVQEYVLKGRHRKAWINLFSGELFIHPILTFRHMGVYGCMHNQ